jgi:HK97 family phage major capsid protein
MNLKRTATARGIQSVRADASATQVLADLQKAWHDFKAEHTAQLAELKKGVADPLTAGKVETINATLSTLQAQMNDIAIKAAAFEMGGAGSKADKDVVAHAKAFNAWFRKGADAGLRELEVQARLTTQSDPDGGFVVPSEMEAGIDRVLGTMSAMRSLATVRQIGAATYKKLVNVGGVTSGWVGENGSRSEGGTPALKALDFPAMELYAQPGATQTMLDDASFNVEAWLADEVSIEFAEQEGEAFISGNGVARPRGILGYDTVANASYSWGKLGFIKTGGASGFAASNPSDALIDLIHSLKRGYRQNGAFLMNDLTVAAVRKFKDSNGNYLWQPSLQAGEPSSLMGYRVETDDNMPDLGSNTFPIAFGDFRRGYVVVDRVGIRVLRDPFTSKPNVLFYTTKRVGGGVQNFEAIKLLKCAA